MGEFGRLAHVVSYIVYVCDSVVGRSLIRTSWDKDHLGPEGENDVRPSLNHLDQRAPQE